MSNVDCLNVQLSESGLAKLESAGGVCGNSCSAAAAAAVPCLPRLSAPSRLNSSPFSLPCCSRLAFEHCRESQQRMEWMG